MKPVLTVAEEATIREGTVDYLPKPFDFNPSENLTPKTAGAIWIETRPRALTEEAVAELNSWDEEGRLITEQIIRQLPHLFPYFIRTKENNSAKVSRKEGGKI